MIEGLKRKVKETFKHRYVRNVSILAGGTAVSQLIGIAVLPLLTRLYSPEDFSALAVYTSVLALLTVVSCLRLEIAIPLPKEKEQAKELLALCLLSALFITLLALLIVVIFSDQIHAMTQGRLTGYLWLIPLGAMLSGFYAAFQYWCTREKSFALISKTRMTQALSGASAQVGLGYIGVTPFGLLFGQLLNVGSGVWGLVRGYWRNNNLLNKEVTAGGLKRTFHEYDRFPKYSTFEALSNSAAIQVPVLLIASYAVGPEVGFLMLAIRLLSAPMALIGGAVAQVYLSEAADNYQRGELKSFTVKTIWSLAKIGAPPIFFAGASAPFLIPIIFGAEWGRTGILIAWMVPWFFMQFITSPVSMALHITGNQKAAFILQLAGLFIRVGSVLLAGVYATKCVAEFYAVSGFLFYMIYQVVVWSVLPKDKHCRKPSKVIK